MRVLECVECGDRSDELGEGWVAYRLVDYDPDEGRPSVAFYCPSCAGRELGYRRPTRRAGTSQAHMEPAQAFRVTMVRPGVVPSFEVGAYEYFGRGLPLVGETILLRRTTGPDAGEVLQGYVTRVNPCSETPIAVTEVAHTPEGDRRGGLG
jgi:hypothetical protein